MPELIDDPTLMGALRDVLDGLRKAGYAVVAVADLRVAVTATMNMHALTEVERWEVEALGRLALAMTDLAALDEEEASDGR